MNLLTGKLWNSIQRKRFFQGLCHNKKRFPFFFKFAEERFYVSFYRNIVFYVGILIIKRIAGMLFHENLKKFHSYYVIMPFTENLVKGFERFSYFFKQGLCC